MEKKIKREEDSWEESFMFMCGCGDQGENEAE